MINTQTRELSLSFLEVDDFCHIADTPWVQVLPYLFPVLCEPGMKRGRREKWGMAVIALFLLC